MPTPRKGARLGGSPAHQRHILANLATALFEHGRITKLGPRKGDNAPMAVIELVTEAYTPAAPKQPKRPATPAAEPAAAAPAAEVEQPSEDAPAEVEAPTESGETEVLDTEATDVETAEAQSEAQTETETEAEKAEKAEDDDKA